MSLLGLIEGGQGRLSEAFNTKGHKKALMLAEETLCFMISFEERLLMKFELRSSSFSLN